MQSMGQAGKLEIQVEVDVLVLSLKDGQLRQNFYVAVWRQNSFFGKFQFLLLSLSTDCIRSIHTMEGNLLCSKPTDLDVSDIKTNKQKFSQQNLD